MRGLRSVNSQSRLLRSVIGALILIGASPVAAEGVLKAALQARYDAMKAAMAAHDGSAISVLLAPDFRSLDISGKSETASQMIAEVNGLKADPNKASVTTLVFISPVGNTVTVGQQYEMKTIRAGTDGVAHQAKVIMLSTDTWVKSGDAWLLQRTVTDDMSLFSDGQLVFHKVKP
jgi:Domain of unknown function (DUF4440)